MSLPALPDPGPHHLLALPGEVTSAQVETLARARFPRAARELGDARDPRDPADAPGRLRLSRHTVLRGPYALAAASLGLPAGVAQGYVAEGIAERGAPPGRWGGDRLGLRRAFPDGLPVRDEARVVDWLIAVARRTGGAVRVAPRGHRGATVLVPEPAAAVDLTVWSPVWLEPDAALALIRRTLPQAVANLPRPWTGPPAGVGEAPARGAEVLTAAQRAALHAAAAEHEAVAAREPLTGYGAYADLGLDGTVALEVTGHPEPPPVAADQAWATAGAVGYALTWVPQYEEDLEAERASVPHRVARARVAALVTAIARDLYADVGGVVTDMMGFAIEPG